MKYYLIRAEVAGGIGPGSVLDTNPVVVHKLEYMFEGWFGDDLLATFPCYIVSQRLADLILQENLTGIELADVKVSFSREYYSSIKKRDVPHFRWLKIVGVAGEDDFGYSPKRRLVVSERALDVLRRVNINYAEIEPYDG